jgi:uncharacterized protein YbdZ (MbtH family)
LLHLFFRMGFVLFFTQDQHQTAIPCVCLPAGWDYRRRQACQAAC